MKKERLSYSALSQFGKSPNHLLDYWQDDMERTPAMIRRYQNLTSLALNMQYLKEQEGVKYGKALKRKILKRKQLQ